MPRGSHDQLFELAQLHDGFFTAAEARAMGLTSKALVGYVARGVLEHPSRGVYRLQRYPEITQNAYLWAAVLWPRAHLAVDAALSHYTALRLHEISDVNPSRTHITVPKSFRLRRDPPPTLEVHLAALPKYDVDFIDGLPVTTVDRTLRDIAATGDIGVLQDALRDARARNIAIPRELRHA